MDEVKNIKIGKIYPFGNLFTLPCTKIKFDPVNYGVIAIKTYRPKIEKSKYYDTKQKK